RNLYPTPDCGAADQKNYRPAAGALLSAFRAMVLRAELCVAGAMDVGQHQGPGLLVTRLGAFCGHGAGLSVHKAIDHCSWPGDSVAVRTDIFRRIGCDARNIASRKRHRIRPGRARGRGAAARKDPPARVDPACPYPQLGSGAVGTTISDGLSRAS